MIECTEAPSYRIMFYPAEVTDKKAVIIMSVKYDTLIIGAGPSGISAAISLQKAGITNAVLEKKEFPRKKTCGGLVTLKTLKALEALLDMQGSDIITAAFCDSSSTVELYHKSEPLTRSQTTGPFYFVKRESFDNFLADTYRGSKGHLYENAGNYSVDFSDKAVHLENGEELLFDHLIVADGALSSTGARLGYPKTHLGFCVESFLPRSDLAEKADYSGEVRIHLGMVDKGYAWVFPSGEEVCVGLGGVYSVKTDYIRELKSFLEQMGITGNDYKIKGAFVPYGEVVDQRKGRDDVVLVGDAGGFVDPIYGEGLYFAIRSGCEAAGAILSSKEKTDGSSFKSVFSDNMQPYVKLIKQGRKLQKYFSSDLILKRFAGRLRGKNEFAAYYCDNQIAEYNYPYNGLKKLHSDYKRLQKNKNSQPVKER